MKLLKQIPPEAILVLFAIIYMVIASHYKTPLVLEANAAYRESQKLSFGETLKNQTFDNKWIINKVELNGNYNEYQRYWMQKAYEISNYDKEFLYMLKAENGLLNHDRQSEWRYANGNREDSWGFCQIHRPTHQSVVNNPKFFTDPYWQLEECYRLWTRGTVFYGWNRYKKNPTFARIIRSHFKF